MTVAALHTSNFEAMNTQVVLQVLAPATAARAALEAARDVFARIEAACTRFVPSSPLVRVNAAPGRLHPVPQELVDALAEAELAHRETAGLFDPRVLRPLAGLGYDRTLPFRSGPVHVPAVREAAAPAASGPWRPVLNRADRTADVGALPIDLGGIGKGLAVREAAAHLARAGRVYLVDAGGDCRFGGTGPEGDGWRVGVEDPFGGDLPVAVLRADDVAIATSSVRLRRWSAGGRQLHHIVDPRTGTSAAGGVRAVTMAAGDPVRAEVWAKALLVAGLGEAPALAELHGLAALWIGDEGRVAVTPAMRPLLLWQRDLEGAR